MINLLFTGNYKMFDGILISSLSILKQTKRKICCYILTMDLSPQNKEYAPINEKHIKYLKKLYKDYNPENEVIKLDATKLFLEQFNSSPNKENFYTPFAFLRLFADQFDLPDKLLYLDTDTMANDDISLLYDIGIENFELGWVKDNYGKKFLSPNYCNSGVMLLNMKKLRETKLLSRALNLCSKKKLFLADQTSINRLIKDSLILPRKFNEQKCLRPDTVIRHFSMTLKFFPYFKKQNIKPWDVENVHKVLKTYQFDDILNDYLSRKQNFNFWEKNNDERKQTNYSNIFCNR